MRNQSSSKTGLFLIELILSIFFFIIATAVVLQLFVKSHFISQNTISVNNALLYSQNMSEVFLANGGDFESVRHMYDADLVEIEGAPDNVLVLLFDKDWKPVFTYEYAKYSIVADYDIDDTFSYLNVYVNNYSENLENFITSGDYKSALLDTGYVYHQEVKQYNGK